MLNRFKLLVLAIILAILTILFLQNQEPLSLKFFCSDTSSDYCFYQTPSSSLAVWMAIFIGLGIFSSLGWQLMNKIADTTTGERKPSSKFPKKPTTRAGYREQSRLREEANFKNNSPISDWEQRRSEDWEQTNLPNFTQDDESLRSSRSTRSNQSDYADKFTKKQEINLHKPWQSEIRQDRPPKESSNSEDTKPKPKPSVSQKTEEVYDASYRTLNNVPPPSSPEDKITEDEDSDWI